MEIMKKNGLLLNEIESNEPTLEKVNDPMEYINTKFQKDGFVVAYLDYKVLIGRYLSGQNKALFYKNGLFDLQFLQKIRVFNQEREAFIWRTEEGFRGRLRIDKNGEGTFVVDANQVLWGTRAALPENGFTRICERRGTELILPFDNLKGVDDKQNRVFLRTRNYIDYNDIGQATYVDSRFMGFRFQGQDLPREEK